MTSSAPLAVENATYASTARARQIYGEVFRLALEYTHGSHIDGDVVEFGCFEGFSSLLLAELIAEFNGDTGFYDRHIVRRLHVYDSFAGFPASVDPIDTVSYEVADSQYWTKGKDASPPGTEAMLRHEFERVLGPDRWCVVPGMYSDSLPVTPLVDPVAIVNLDCDLFASSVQVLEHLLGRCLLPDGAVLLLDDYNCNRANPRFGMRRALRECFAATGGFYEFSEFTNYGWHGRAFFVHRMGDSPDPDA